ncbi:SNF2 family N-terminal domain-containing protein [Gaertneriomyces semiglobifer]|nr:SNF2 family N-terminal domain-containing protein [Gaertneriomyces semiglobifer]
MAATTEEGAGRRHLNSKGSNPSEQEPASPIIVKRGPGRPRKVPLPAPSEGPPTSPTPTSPLVEATSPPSSARSLRSSSRLASKATPTPSTARQPILSHDPLPDDAHLPNGPSAAAVTPVAKRRGRPPKSATPAVTPALVQASTPTPIHTGGSGRGRQVKGSNGRGPGRPAKISLPLPPLTSGGNDSPQTPVKRPPGRPRKTPKLTEDEDSIAARQSLLSALKMTKKSLISQKTQQLRECLDRYDDNARELYLLDNNAPMAEYDPVKLKTDKGDLLNRYVGFLDLRAKAAQEMAQRQAGMNDEPGRGKRKRTNIPKEEMNALIDQARADIEAAVPREGAIPRWKTDFEGYLDAFVIMDDEEVTKEVAQERWDKELELNRKIEEFRNMGLLTGLTVAELERRPPPPPRTHWQHLLEEMAVVSRGFAHAGKHRIKVTRMCSKAILKYWDALKGEGERMREAEERRWKKVWKGVIKEMRKRWRLVEQVVTIEWEKVRKEEQREVGRKHLDRILEHSTQVLRRGGGSSAASSEVGDMDDFVNGEEDPDEDFRSESEHSEEEMIGLQKEMEVPIEELVGSGYFDYRPPESLDEADRDDDDDEDEPVESNTESADHEVERAASIDSMDVDSPGFSDHSPPPTSTVEHTPASSVVSSPQPLAASSTSSPAVIYGDTGMDDFTLDDATDDEDQAAERELDAEEGMSDDDEVDGLKGDLEMSVEELKEWMRRMEEAQQQSPVPAPSAEHDVGSLKASTSQSYGEDAFSDKEEDEEDEQAERDLDDEEGMSDDDEVEGLKDDMNMDVDELKAWMKRMEEEHQTENQSENDEDSGNDSEDGDNDVPGGESGLDTDVKLMRHETESPPLMNDTGGNEKGCNEAAVISPTRKSLIEVVGSSTQMGANRSGHATMNGYVANSADHEPDDILPENGRVGNGMVSLKMVGSEVSNGVQPIARTTPAPESRSDQPDNVESEREATPASHIHTPIPFLLKHTLREYQHLGLDWLANLYEKGLNGILADEMGLGKTIQTIALFAHLAVHHHNWGPHLVVVPTSVMLNWEREFKKWLPAFKILTYYGSIAERHEKRRGWSKPNAFHVCITSYQLVLRDHHILRRRKWVYMVLDEAHHIKNFRSRRWEVMLGFKSERRLLLTGTPLQNDLMELWSLMFFLMPGENEGDNGGAFAGRGEFREWFEGGVSKIVKGGMDLNDAETRESVMKLHGILRPYILRRLKSQVEKQMPGKFEHVIKCRLSKRQRFLYDEFMGRAKTKESLAKGDYFSVVNVLMQLRKVCNHPDLFEERGVQIGFAMPEGGVVEKVLSTEGLLIWRRLLRAADDAVDLDALGLSVLHLDREMRWSQGEVECLTELNPSRAIGTGLVQCVTREVEARSLLPSDPTASYRSLVEWEKVKRWHRAREEQGWWERVGRVNEIRLGRRVLYGAGLLRGCKELGTRELDTVVEDMRNGRRWNVGRTLRGCVRTAAEWAQAVDDDIQQFACVVPKVVIKPWKNILPPPGLVYPRSVNLYQLVSDLEQACPEDVLARSKTYLSLSFPDKTLLQYDCGKLQTLHRLMVQLEKGGHRALIFTQMTRMLDILEKFLNLHGWRYMRLDGSTKVEQRQYLCEKFNTDKRYLCFILSTRSGGLGLNLTGADTVIFYDGDWNPAMDAQAQDRAHRIGQTREVHIYRFVSEYTIEENMLRKADEKRRLDQVVIQQGDFTTEFLEKTKEKVGDWRDWLGDMGLELGTDDEDGGGGRSVVATDGIAAEDLEKAMMSVEDESDRAALRNARLEVDTDVADFGDEATASSGGGLLRGNTPMSIATTVTSGGGAGSKKRKRMGSGTTTSGTREASVVSLDSTGEEEEAIVSDGNVTTERREPAALDEYLFRLQIHIMGLEEVLDWRDFAEELRIAGEERDAMERDAQGGMDAI